MKKLLFPMLILFLMACGNDDDTSNNSNQDNFNRSEMLVHWADNIILPSYEAYLTRLNDLNSASQAFNDNPTEQSLEHLRSKFVEAYREWQKVSVFEIGPAKEFTLRNFTNIYPTDEDQIESNISTSTYNFNLPSSFAEQGFPALDYLLFGSASNDSEILLRFQSEGPAISNYLKDLTERLLTLTNQVVDGWNNNYYDNFIQQSGNSASASTDIVVNELVFYYEKALRAGKFGIPAGVFSSNPLPQNVEALYHSTLSKTLALDALNTVQNFFNGLSINGDLNGVSLDDYLVSLGREKNEQNLSLLINDQLNIARTAIQSLNDNFEQQVQENNTGMLMAYDELQKNVVNLKVDMMQAMNISVTFVDADGD